MAGKVRDSARKAGVADRAGAASAGEVVAAVAYELFEQRGRVHGHDLEDWIKAERIVRQRRRRGA
jgi:hypothetical protein